MNLHWFYRVSTFPLASTTDCLSTGLEEFQLKSTVHYTPKTANGEGHAKGDSQPTQDPIEIPVEAVFRRLFY